MFSQNLVVRGGASRSRMHNKPRWLDALPLCMGISGAKLASRALGQHPCALTLRSVRRNRSCNCIMFTAHPLLLGVQSCCCRLRTQLRRNSAPAGPFAWNLGLLMICCCWRGHLHLWWSEKSILQQLKDVCFMCQVLANTQPASVVLDNA